MLVVSLSVFASVNSANAALKPNPLSYISQWFGNMSERQAKIGLKFSMEMTKSMNGSQSGLIEKARLDQIAACVIKQNQSFPISVAPYFDSLDLAGSMRSAIGMRLIQACNIARGADFISVVSNFSNPLNYIGDRAREDSFFYTMMRNSHVGIAVKPAGDGQKYVSIYFPRS